MWHKQASVNRWIGKQVKKILLETFKTPWMKFKRSKVFLKELIFSQMLLKDFVEIFQNAYREKYTFQWHLPEKWHFTWKWRQ